jgi:hypothetical protein
MKRETMFQHGGYFNFDAALAAEVGCLEQQLCPALRPLLNSAILEDVFTGFQPPKRVSRLIIFTSYYLS